jgi:hypothetical protein
MLDTLLTGVPRTTFLERYWGQAALHTTNPQLLDRQLFRLGDVVDIVAFLRPCDARVRVIRDGEQAWKADLRDPQIAALLRDALTRGETLGIERLDLFWPPVVELCGALAAELGCPVHANAYLTPGGAAGLAPHFDTHDVFVLQLEGEKDWSLGQLEWSQPTERVTDGSVSELRAHTELRLRRGDVLYVPRGMVHRARSAATHSLHVTLGCIPYTLGDELVELTHLASRQLAALRASAAPSLATPEGRREQLVALLGQLAELAGDPTLPRPQRIPSQTRTAYRREDALTHFRTALDLARITAASRFAMRRSGQLELIHRVEHGWALHDGSQAVPLEDELVPATRSILAMPGAFSLTDLPPELERPPAVRAIVRLVSAGTLDVVAAPP